MRGILYGCFMLRRRKMNVKNGVMILFSAVYVVSEMVLLSRGEAPFTGKQNCSYTVLIETTCTKGAGTSDHISLRFGSSNTTDILVHHLNTKHRKTVDNDNTTVLDDIPRHPLRACAVDQFQVMGPCVESQVCYLYLKHRGKDDWRPGVAQVLVPAAAGFSSQTFYFRRYLPRNVWHGSSSCDAKFTPFGIKHPRMVFDDKHKIVTKVLF